MIKEFEFYHGVVFAKLIHSGKRGISIKPFYSNNNSSYILNERTGLYIKYSTKRLSPWHFSFQKINHDEIIQMKNQLGQVFLILVCGEDGIVTLSFEELKKIINETRNEVEWISASRNPKKEYTVKGSDGGLGHKVGKSDFPKKIYEMNWTFHYN